VVLDPAHGGPDAGAKLGDQLLEKDVTLALAARLRASLNAAGFTVISTRQADGFDPLSNDQRAETANRVHAVACLVIHATGTGRGVHLYASALDARPTAPPADPDPDYRPPFVPTPWETAQADSLPQSLRLRDDLGAGLRSAGLTVITGRASVRPLDNLTCPAVAVEVAPLAVDGDDPTPVSDPGYQQRIAEAVAHAAQTWRGHVDAATVPASSPASGGKP
jgi:N-acetylmuramoyl-L-alanine amidase